MSTDLKSYLKNVLPEDELAMLVRSYDVVGDIAIIIIPESLTHREHIIGEAILANNNCIKVVVRRSGTYSGEFRTVQLKIIAGEGRKETVHREYGIRLSLNLEDVYFSVRSGTERFRIASLVQPGEDILVLFSGIGPYPLVISGNSQARSILGIEKNPLAMKYARKNLGMNRSVHNVKLLEGDVSDVLPGLNRRFDRLIMPLPKGGEGFLPLALDKLKSGGFIHYYSMQSIGHFHLGHEVLRKYCDEHGKVFCHIQDIKCGHCGPRTFRICTEGRVI